MTARLPKYVVLVLAALLLAAPALAQTESGLMLGDDPRIVEADLSVTLFAEGLNFPSGIAVLPDGSLLVATSRPDGGRYYDSVGELIRLVDAGGDGVADGPGEALATGLPGELTALAIDGNLVAVLSAQWDRESIHFLQLRDEGGFSLNWLGQIGFDFGDVYHQSYGLTFRPSQGDPGAYQLFFNVGSAANEEAGPPVALYGLTGGSVLPASIYSVSLDFDGADLSAAEPVLIASGVRNAMGLAFDPDTGDFWFADNGINDAPAINRPAGVDALHTIPAADLGGEARDFGFPDSFTIYETGEKIGDGTIDPVFEFHPQNGSESVGPSSLIAAPGAFPDGLNSGFLVGFHGLLDATGLDNPTNPLVYVDADSGDRFELISNQSPGIGHLNSLATTDTALYVADLCNQSIMTTTPCGMIWRIAA